MIKQPTLTPEEWGEREARKAPPWSAEDMRRIAALFGLKTQILPRAAKAA